MFERLHKRLGTAGLILSVAALVLALTGAAFAASGALTAKQKKEVKAIAKGLVGTGPEGKQGPAGTNGTNGKDGANGTPGTNGTNGKTVLHGSGAPSVGVGTEGDFYIDTTANKIYGPKTTVWGSGTELKGKEGSPWTTGGTLPASTEPGCPCTETGTWTLTTQASGLALVPISFPIPLAASLPGTGAHYISNSTGKEIVYNGGTEEDEEVAQPLPTPCTGSAAEPKAEPGNLCIYQGFRANAKFEKFGKTSAFLGPGVDTAGGALAFKAASGAFSLGTWAVTAE
ncbi:MAG TPA: hypothetical protein VNY83_02550 [Solirubrobacterales bacterium]|jgi:hypothetical protein|nr:hypothetical protein [Solirubrobacterales bacterium]